MGQQSCSRGLLRVDELQRVTRGCQACDEFTNSTPHLLLHSKHCSSEPGHQIAPWNH